jgi:hypothetical protein
MAKATKQMAVLAAEPYLSFVALEVIAAVDPRTTPPTPGFDIRLHFLNPGQVRVTYDVQLIIVTLAGVEYQPTTFYNHTAVVHPKETSIFNYPSFECHTPMSPGLEGTLEFKAKFWAEENDRKTFALSRRWKKHPRLYFCRGQPIRKARRSRAGKRMVCGRLGVGSKGRDIFNTCESSTKSL